MLTELELEALHITARLASLACLIVGDGPTRDDDLNEIYGHIHVLEKALMAQAAARAYPLLGQTIPKETR